jgi:hypothetical protein
MILPKEEIDANQAVNKNKKILFIKYYYLNNRTIQHIQLLF